MSDEKKASKEPDARALAWGPGIAIGLGFGVAVGVAIGNIGVGIAIGAGIGVTFAIIFGEAAKRRQAGEEPPADGPDQQPPTGD